MDEIKLVYVDDDVDDSISEYLNDDYAFKGFKIKYKEVHFNSAEGYDTLIKNPLVIEANIILIDSKLFQNNRVISGKFTGEEFKMILKKVFPFIEVIVITQNDLEENYGEISKYKGGLEESAQVYYSKKLKEELDKAIKNINIYRNIANKLRANEDIDKVLIEKILNSFEGTNSPYDELTSSDIDSLISMFEELKRGEL